MKHILDETEQLLLTSHHETIELTDKATGALTYVGDHYGEASCGALSPDGQWGVTGGEGLVFFDRQGLLIYAFRDRTDHPAKACFEFAVPSEKEWLYATGSSGTFSVHALRIESAKRLRVLLDPWSEYASTWLLDTQDRQIIRATLDPDRRGTPWTDQVVF